jgi:hypothetical protein
LSSMQKATICLKKVKALASCDEPENKTGRNFTANFFGF